MALTQNEKKLLAGVKYYNEQAAKDRIAKLAAKLDREFGRDVTVQLTGFSSAAIDKLLLQVKPRKVTLKVDKKDVGELPTNNLRTPIHVDEESDSVQRVAYEMTMLIGAKYKSGDKFMGQKEGMEEFGCSPVTLTAANKILLSNNWIEQADPGNPRKGYVVK